MNTSSNPQRDAKLAELLGELADNRRTSVDELAVAHPELAVELRELWGAMLVANAVADFHSAQNVADLTPVLHKPTRSAVPPIELGDYRLHEELGRGGMGVVYRATQVSLNRTVAVKFILGGDTASREELQRFRSEAESVARLDHPNIVPIFEIGEEQGWHFFSMQFIEGETLSQRLQKGPLPEREAAELMQTIAQAIQYAHDQGVVHRDLKPANILIDATGQPQVTDFGLAKRLTDAETITQTGAIMGTPSYMAPEQAAGSRGKVGKASDVYSLGTILYALLTGKPPFIGTSPVNTMMMVVDQDPLPPRMVNRQLDRDLEMIVLKCLQKPADLRYSSAGALADDLNAYLTGEPVRARSGKFSQVVAQLFRETNHASVLENWGLLWMLHAAVLLVLCVTTNWVHLQRTAWPIMNTPLPYLLLWGGGIAVWAPIFWSLRRRAGPVTAVERQIAHVWGGSVIAVVLLFVVEYLLGLPVLTLSPALGLINGMVFTVKAGILTGMFYFHAMLLYATAIAMAMMQHHDIPYGITLFGVVSAIVFFQPGWKYFKQSRQNVD